MLGVVNTDENHAPNIVTGDPFLEADELGDTDGASCTPAQEANLTLARIKIATEAHKANTSSMPSLEATSPSYRPSEGDTGSVHSLPVAHVTETQSAQTRPSTALAHSLSGATPIASAAVARTQQSAIREATTIAGGERMNRHRSGVESRASNRLSGFFSNLIHRRDGNSAQASRSGLREEQTSPAPGDSSSVPVSRSSSPGPARAVTPPPSLPAPTLQELGLSLSALTSDLSPSHFSTPPSSGAFLAPHYLLLCHAQGLDVLPLVSPPAAQPYALVRRVSFKSVVVMEQRGVLVAIAGRRDGVRVYALEEVKKAVEWRIEMEVRRERERARREEAKKSPIRGSSILFDSRDSSEKHRSNLLPPIPTPLPLPTSNSSSGRSKSHRKSAQSASGPSVNSSPRTPTLKKSKSPARTTSTPSQSTTHECPPPYSNPSDTPCPQLPNSSSVVSLSRPRRSSVSNVLAAASAPARRSDASRGPDSKPDDWIEGRGASDDEAIDIVAAGASGSQALDERTSAGQPPAPPRGSEPAPITLGHSGRSQSNHSRRNRPANLDLSLARPNIAPVAHPPPSPTPTLLSLRQALLQPPSPSHRANETPEPDIDDEEEEAPAREAVSLAQILLESRIPDLPPAGTRQPQQPIIIGESNVPSSPRSSIMQGPPSQPSTFSRTDNRRRRRWSVLDGFFSGEPATSQLSASAALTAPSQSTPPTTPDHRDRRSSQLLRSQSSRPSSSATHLPSSPTTPLPPRPASAGVRNTSLVSDMEAPPVPAVTVTPETPTHSRFIPRIISNAFQSRRSEDQSQTPLMRSSETDINRKAVANPTGHMPPPKLEYVKLPGTKSSLMIKAVETARKSFLAILCGENGEKVELFAGTYRTALGLSRTFILPDSPRSLELQLQGDDLVEVFLVFAQNIFGLEPATVRVREVRIGRAERRAARRRAREIISGSGDMFDTDPPGQDDETNVNLNIGVSVAAGVDPIVSTGDTSTLPISVPPSSVVTPEALSTPAENSNGALAHAEELVALATAQMGPYTTFQQLSFAPSFPLASIADDYIIPPTYSEFLNYRAEHEPEVNGSSNVDLAQVQFSPPGLPVPTSSPPPKWFYQDPKGVIHGPWKASLMQAWYKDGLLPPDLPVRREEETGYTLLKDLRLQSVDPTHPFRSIPPPFQPQSLSAWPDTKPLLRPISLLSQPKHYGPPALFFSSQGGHSTTIVDARGRSVLKGRFIWSADEQDDEMSSATSKMGDVKRLEAFDVKDRSVIVAMRHGGLEAMDLGDALLKPADESRPMLPQFTSLPSHTNRRGPFVWRIGTPITSSVTSCAALSNKSKGLTTPIKKQGSGPGKSPHRTEFSTGSDGELASPDEVMFLGRWKDDIYFCERNAGAFRILRLCPNITS